MHKVYTDSKAKRTYTNNKAKITTKRTYKNSKAKITNVQGVHKMQSQITKQPTRCTQTAKPK